MKCDRVLAVGVSLLALCIAPAVADEMLITTTGTITSGSETSAKALPLNKTVAGFYCRGCKQHVTVYISARKEGSFRVGQHGLVRYASGVRLLSGNC